MSGYQGSLIAYGFGDLCEKNASPHYFLWQNTNQALTTSVVNSSSGYDGRCLNNVYILW